MRKKVFLIVLSITFFIFYGCSTMKHSTIVLYVSHKVEGPLYIPKPESPVLAQSPQTNRENQVKKPAKEAKRSKPSREGQTTQEEQTSRNNQVITNTYNDYQTRTLPRGEFLILDKPIRFAFEKYGIGSYYDDTFQYVANYMKEYTNVQLVVEGHTDRVGPKEFNKGLSLKRSRATITKLTRTGIKRDRLIPSGVNSRFLEYNLNRLNRRVEFIIIRSDEDLTNYINKVK